MSRPCRAHNASSGSGTRPSGTCLLHGVALRAPCLPPPRLAPRRAAGLRAKCHARLAATAQDQERVEALPRQRPGRSRQGRAPRSARGPAGSPRRPRPSCAWPRCTRPAPGPPRVSRPSAAARPPAPAHSRWLRGEVKRLKTGASGPRRVAARLYGCTMHACCSPASAAPCRARRRARAARQPAPLEGACSGPKRKAQCYHRD